MIRNFRNPIICLTGTFNVGKTTLFRQLNPGKSIREFLLHPTLSSVKVDGNEEFDHFILQYNINSWSEGIDFDVAIVLIDIEKGIEDKTIEIISILCQQNKPFILGINKVDNLVEYTTKSEKYHLDLLAKISSIVYELENLKEFKKDLLIKILELSIQNSDGVGEMFSIILNFCIENEEMKKRLCFLPDHFSCSVGRKKVINQKTIYEACLLNGILKLGDRLVGLTNTGPKVCKVIELIDRNEEKIEACELFKFCLDMKENLLTGFPLFLLTSDDQIPKLFDQINNELNQVILKINQTKSTDGIIVKSSGLTSLKFLVEFLNTIHLDFKNASLLPLSEKDVFAADSVFVKNKTIWIFTSQPIDELYYENQDIFQLAENLKIKILINDTIYGLYEMYIDKFSNLIL